MRRLCRSVTLSLAFLACASEAHAADALSIVGDTKKPREVKLAAGSADQPATGTLRLIVRNSTARSGALKFDFASTADAVEVETNPSASQLAVDARSVTPVVVTLRVKPAGEATPSLAGALSVRFADESGVAPAVLQVAGAAATEASFEQKSASWTVTRIWGPLPRLLDEVALVSDAPKPVTGTLNGKADVVMRNAGGLSTDPVAQTLLAAENGRLLRAVLHPPEGNGAGLWRGLIDATDVARTGEYSGTLRLDPDDTESSALEVKVRVQDLILWPLLVIFAGAYFGGYGRRVYEQRRQRWQLLAALKEPVEAYDAAYSTRAEGLADLDDRLGKPGSEAASRRYSCASSQRRAETSTGDVSAAAASAAGSSDEKQLELTEVFCSMQAAKDAVKLAAAEQAVGALADDVKAWVGLNESMRDLRTAIELLPSDEQLGGTAWVGHGSADVTLLRRDTEQLAAGPPELGDGAAMLRFGARADRQVAVVGAFASAWKEFVTLADELGGTSSPEHDQARSAMVALDPRRVYANAPREYRRSEEEDGELIAQLTHGLRELAWYRRDLTSAQPDECNDGGTVRADRAAVPLTPEEELHEAWRQERVGQVSLGLMGMPASLDIGEIIETVRGHVRTEAPASTPTVRTAAQLRTQVRFWDRSVFLVSATVISLAYLLPLYIGKSFGDWDDYLTAFAAGFVGTVVVPWELLPIFRVDKKVAEAKAQADTAAAAG